MVYVVERYLPGLLRSDLLRTLAELERATEELRVEGSVVRYLGSTIVIGDEACFCHFEAPSEVAVAETNRRAGVAFDRIVPAVTVSPTEGEFQMSVPTTISEPIRLRRRWPFGIAAAALAAGATALVLAIGQGTDTSETAVAPSPGPTASAKELQRVDALSSMTPAQLAAAFGTETAVAEAPTSGHSPKVSPYVEALGSMTPAQLAAAFGTEGVPEGLRPKERRYVEAISSMTPAQLEAAFGTGR
jgi:Protein of unknown function (DUF4242)